MILNLTQHQATPEQVAAGVVDLNAVARAELQQQLTFTADSLLGPGATEHIEERARLIVSRHVLPRIAEVILQRAARVRGNVEALNIYRDAGRSVGCMIGGAPYLMPALQQALADAGQALRVLRDGVTDVSSGR